ncbi:hypothetical protein M3Y94_00109000 [Aphelenchoides besseyi]|nr:hypothetical protein M3Y94_00109000 [Aphelenchoides besseyi]
MSYKSGIINWSIFLHEIFDLVILILMAVFLGYNGNNDINGSLFDSISYMPIYYVSLVVTVISILFLGILVMGNRSPVCCLIFLVVHVVCRILTLITGIAFLMMYNATLYDRSVSGCILAAGIISLISTVLVPVFCVLVIRRYSYVRNTPKRNQSDDGWKRKQMVLVYLAVFLFAGVLAVSALLAATGTSRCADSCSGSCGNCGGSSSKRDDEPV